MWYLIKTHNSKTIKDRFIKLSTIGVDSIARVCCKSQVPCGSVRLLRALKVAVVVAATTVSRQPRFSGLFRPTPKRKLEYLVETKSFHSTAISQKSDKKRVLATFT